MCVREIRINPWTVMKKWHWVSFLNHGRDLQRPQHCGWEVGPLTTWFLFLFPACPVGREAVTDWCLSTLFWLTGQHLISLTRVRQKHLTRRDWRVSTKTVILGSLHKVLFPWNFNFKKKKLIVALKQLLPIAITTHYRIWNLCLNLPSWRKK